MTAGRARVKVFGTIDKAICYVIASSIVSLFSPEPNDQRPILHLLMLGFSDIFGIKAIQFHQKSSCSTPMYNMYDVSFAYLFSFPPSLPFPFASARRVVTLVFISSYALCSSKTASRSRLTVSKTLALTIS
jgi:hypothetical protein